MRIKTLILGICFLWVLQSSSFAEKAVVLKQDDAPLKITGYKNKYGAAYRSGYEITHSVTCANVSEKKIVAVKIGIVAFDAFNEFLGRFAGISIGDVIAGKPKKFSWSQSPYGVFKFEKYGTGVVYVKTVRFGDGIIWEVDTAEVVFQIQEIQEGFTADLLEEKKEK